MLATQLEKTMQNLYYSRPCWGFTFAAHVECHKTTFQPILALVKKTNYVSYNPGNCVYLFLNSIMDPFVAQTKLSLDANCDQYSDNFDATVQYLMNQVTHQQVNQQVNIASVGSSIARKLKICDNCRNNLKMPPLCYLPKAWA